MKRLLSTLPAALAACLACAFAAPAAQANANLLGFVMDDDMLLYGTYQDRESAMSSMRAMGVDGVRVTVSWKFVSGEQKGRPRRRPARLKGKRAEDPRNYRSDIWDRFDDVV